MTYEPKPSEVIELVSELLDQFRADEDVWLDALIANKALAKALVDAKFDDDKNWFQMQLRSAINEYILSEHELVTKATNSLIAEAGTDVQVAVDDFEFNLHDTRY